MLPGFGSYLFAWVLMCDGSGLAAAVPTTVRTEANVPIEISFTAKEASADPFNDLTVDVNFH